MGITSALVVSGSLLTAGPGADQSPETVTDDTPEFRGRTKGTWTLINVKKCVLDVKLQAEDRFVLKVSSGDT